MLVIVQMYNGRVFQATLNTCDTACALYLKCLDARSHSQPYYDHRSTCSSRPAPFS